MSGSTKLVIDAQILQTTAWERGMGRYCRSLLEEYGTMYGSDNVTLIINRNLPFDDDRSRAIKALLPGARVEVLDLPTLTGNIALGKRTATAQLDRFLAQAYADQTVDFLLLQLFTFDYCAAFPTHARKMVIIYDLIPLTHWAQFSPLFAAHMYFPHFSSIFEADTVLVISQSAKDQLVDSFGLDPACIVNLRGATIARLSVKKVDSIDIRRPFILMVTADMPHKNNLNAVRAFEAFNRELGNVCQLVLTSNVSEANQRLLSCYCDNLVFVGSVADNQLAYLYKHAMGLLFVSSLEGLGLPILEAVQEDKPVVCSSIDVFKEISSDAFYYCDPNNVDSILLALRQLAGHVDWEAKHAGYATIKREFTWENSARLMHEAVPTETVRPAADRTPLDVFLPNPAQRDAYGGILAQAVLPGLLQHLPNLRLHISSGNDMIEGELPLFLPWACRTYAADKLPAAGDKVLYFIDETDASAGVVRTAMLRPGACCVVGRKTDVVLQGMLTRGYISRELYKNYQMLSKKTTLSDLLRETGNTVYEVRRHERGLTIKDARTETMADMAEFGRWLEGIANDK